ncbi:MAG TPA: hypothetical protein VFX76_12305, partial [Roseiflexaceae bacterium]|nr:hypothetical protein [Roseiflexaceae bacterium]
MNSSQVRTAGLVAYIHAAVIVLVLILGFVFAASMISDAAKGKTVTPGSFGITSILGWIQAIVYIAMLYLFNKYLVNVRKHTKSQMLIYVIIAIELVQIILGIVGLGGVASFSAIGVGAIISLVLTIAKGVLMIIVGVQVMGAIKDSGAMKGFAILYIIAGACTAVILLIFLAPFLAIAYSICLGVALSAEAKKVT